MSCETSIPQKQKCTYCNGKGWFNDGRAADDDPIGSVGCPKCDGKGFLMVVPVSLKARAEAAYRANLDREEAEAARKEFDRRTAHVERLRGLCTTILQLSEPPFIRWCNIPGCGNEERERKPVACIDGLCFTCDAVQEEDYICLITFLPRGYNAQWIYTLSDLGENLKKTHAVLGHMVGDTIIPLERSSNSGNE